MQTYSKLNYYMNHRYSLNDFAISSRVLISQAELELKGIQVGLAKLGTATKFCILHCGVGTNHNVDLLSF